MSSFNGTWQDQNNAKITINGSQNFLTVTYDNGRGPFQGYEINLTSPVIDVNFTDDQPYVGVLGINNGQTQIFWINATVWTKIS